LVDPEKREILRFRVVLRAEMGQQRKDGGRSPGFIQSVTALVDRFYDDVLQHLVAWAPKAPPSVDRRPAQLVADPIEDRLDLTEAMDAARAGSPVIVTTKKPASAAAPAPATERRAHTIRLDDGG
jgi:hypothetical protein